MLIAKAEHLCAGSFVSFVILSGCFLCAEKLACTHRVAERERGWGKDENTLSFDLMSSECRDVCRTARVNAMQCAQQSK